MTQPEYVRISGAAITIPERHWICKAAARVEKACEQTPVIVNIGVMWGCTLHCLREGSPEALLYGVDIDFHTRAVQGDPNATLLRGRSQELGRTFPREIDLLLVDGDHTYESVRGDILAWVPKVRVGGVVIFHDYAPAPGDLRRDATLAGVRNAVDELMPPAIWQALVDAPDSLKAFQRGS